MDSAAADFSKITVPVEDGAVGQALDDLDARIAAWSNAMQQAQRALAEMLEHTRARALAAVPAEASVKQAAAAPAQSTSTDKPQAAAKTRESKKDSTVSEPSPARPAAGDPPKVTREMLGQAPKRKAGPAKLAAEDAKTRGGKPAKGFAAKLKRMVGGQAEEGNAPPQDAEKAAADQKSQNEQATAPLDEDETLLATLDPKVAKVIRIKRRLSNGKKSVRELLSEM